MDNLLVTLSGTHACNPCVCSLPYLHVVILPSFVAVRRVGLYNNSTAILNRGDTALKTSVSAHLGGFPHSDAGKKKALNSRTHLFACQLTLPKRGDTLMRLVCHY